MNPLEQFLDRTHRFGSVQKAETKRQGQPRDRRWKGLAVVCCTPYHSSHLLHPLHPLHFCGPCRPSPISSLSHPISLPGMKHPAVTREPLCSSHAWLTQQDQDIHGVVET